MSRALILLSITVFSAPLLGDGRSPSSHFSVTAPTSSVLRPAYTIRMTSAWRQRSVEGSDCVKGGEEVIAGKLVRLEGGHYVGELERSATMAPSGASNCRFPERARARMPNAWRTTAGR
jgi:hypothetical protein